MTTKRCTDHIGNLAKPHRKRKERPRTNDDEASFAPEKTLQRRVRCEHGSAAFATGTSALLARNNENESEVSM
jgi:hypothetical protein